MGSVSIQHLTAAVIAGVLAPLVHLVCGRIALVTGWLRGYMREGFLHGMLLGPLGLATVLVLTRRARPSERIGEEYHRLSRDPSGALFLSAAALFYLALGTGYGLRGARARPIVRATRCARDRRR